MIPDLRGHASRRLLAVVPALLVLAVGAIAIDRARLVVADVEAVDKSHRMLDALEPIETALLEAEASQRAYLLTHDTLFRAQQRAAREKLQQSLDNLRAVGGNHPESQRDLAAIGVLATERVAILDAVIRESEQQPGRALRADALLPGKRKMDELRVAVWRLRSREQALLDDRRREERRGLRNATVAIAAASIAAVVLSMLVNLAFSRAIKETVRANEALRGVNEDLERQAEELAAQALELETQAVELEATAEDLRSSNDALSATTGLAERARDDAEKSRLQLEAVLDSIPDAVSVYDSDWRWIYVNPAAEGVLASLGFDPGQMLGVELWGAVPHLKGTKFETETLRAARENMVVEYEEYLQPIDTWLEVRIVPSNGTIMTFSRDITRRKRAEEATSLLDQANGILSSSLEYETTLSSLARVAVGGFADWCSVVLLDNDGKPHQVVVSHVDPERVRWAKELNGKYPPPADAITGVPQVIRTGKPEIYPDITDDMLVAGAVDAEHLTIMRELRMRSAIIVPMTARGRTLGALTLVTTDSGRLYKETDLALAMELGTRAAMAIDNAHLYQSALAASEAKSAFLATMSHELRTPLNAIIGYESLMEEGIGGPLSDAQRTQLGRIKASAHHLLGLIDEVLTFSRVEAGKEVVRRETVELEQIVAEAVAMINPLAREKRQEIRTEGAPVTIYTDPSKVRQILLNLLSNAVKFSESGEIIVRSGIAADVVSIKVIDRGIGIGASNLEKVFDAFWQVEQRSTRKVGGTGLGLSVSRSLARILGGDVTVESEPERGSTFTVTLPLRRESKT